MCFTPGLNSLILLSAQLFDLSDLFAALYRLCHRGLAGQPVRQEASSAEEDCRSTTSQAHHGKGARCRFPIVER